MTARGLGVLALFLLLLLLIPLVASAKPVDSSIGVCTRKDEFAKRQAALDVLVAQLAATERESKAKGIRRRIVTAAKADIECLIRYREPCLVPVFAEIAVKNKKWFTKTRALYALKMLASPDGIPAAVVALGDRREMVREAAASALGHIGGPKAAAALRGQQKEETDPYVLATIEASLAMDAAGERPYDEYRDGEKFVEELVGPEGAKRVAWAWTVKGEKLFNHYDAKSLDYPEAVKFCYPIMHYEEDLFAGFPRNSFGAGGTHAGEDCAWFREGSGMYAIADGIVRMVQGAGGDWGFLVAIEHRLPDGSHLVSVYGHLAFDVLVDPGDVVTAGQKIGTQGLSTSVENGGYGSHLHFGLGDGPFRRPTKPAVGETVGILLDDGTKAQVPVIGFTYSRDQTNQHDWPLTAMRLRLPDGTIRTAELPEQPLAEELSWFQAYVKDCAGWLNPQEVLPKLVGGSK